MKNKKQKAVSKNTNVYYDPVQKLMNVHGLSKDEAELQAMVKYQGFEDIIPPDMKIWVVNTDQEWETVKQIFDLGCWLQENVIKVCKRHFYRYKRVSMKSLMNKMVVIKGWKRASAKIPTDLFKDTIKYALYNFSQYQKKEISEAVLNKRCKCVMWYKSTNGLAINAHKQEIKIPSPDVTKKGETFTIKTENLKERNSLKNIKLKLDETTEQRLEIHLTHSDQVQHERTHLAMVSDAVGIKNYWGKQGAEPVKEEVAYTVDLEDLFS